MEKSMGSSKKPSAGESSKKKAPVVDKGKSSAKKKPSQMSKEEYRAHRRPIESASKRRCRAREKERLKTAEAIIGKSPSQRKERMLGEYTAIVGGLGDLTKDTFATVE